MNMFFNKFFKNDGHEKLKKFTPVIARINELETKITNLSADALQRKTTELKTRLSKGESLDDILPEAFACVREAAKRTLNQRHYDAQLLGGIVLHYGNIAEMKTGEGKTLAATAPVYLNALNGKGVHVVTVNDYLARRDVVWMGQIYHALGLTIGVLNSQTSFLYDPSHKDDDTHGALDEKRDAEGGFKVIHEFLRPCSKKDAYEADITYGTNNEFGFDYLRDNIAYRTEDVSGRLIQSGADGQETTGSFAYAIVDEIDSILIDEARTPLIISAPSQEPESLYYTFAKIAVMLQQEKDFTVDEKMRAIQLTDDGITKTEKMLGIGNIYTEKGIKYVHHLECSVRAKALFQKDKEYVVRDGDIVIVDEFTGRLQPGRRWSEGLHQAIEAKEGLRVQRESRTIASITFQNYFRLYDKLSGMTGTALTSSEEFQRVYNLDVISVPTHKPMIRDDKNDLIFQTEKGKLKALASRIKELHKKEQPVLVGTVSIEKNEILSAYLQKEGVPHEILNAKNHEREGEIIAQAGRLGGVTIATNMAGRGVDIILGGNPPNLEHGKKVRELDGLHVIGTERHEARRIDDQLRGRAGRQGDPGTSQFFVSLEDTLMRVFASDKIKTMMGKFGIAEDQPIENRFITRALENAQTKIEGFNFDSRKHVLAFDDVLNHQRKSIYDLRRSILVGDTKEVKIFMDEALEAHPDAGEVIQAKEKALGEEEFWKIIGKVILQAVDIHWMEHLETMDYLRSSVNLRAYGQREPLVEYKKEGLRLFREMKESLYQHVVELLPQFGEGIKLKHDANQGHEINEKQNDAKMSGAGLVKTGLKNHEHGGSGKNKVGRNDPCPCGSGKKYKKCHGGNA